MQDRFDGGVGRCGGAVQTLPLIDRLAEEEGAMDLARVAPEGATDFGDQRVASLQQPIRLVLARHEGKLVGLAHRRRRHEVDTGVATGLQIRALDQRRQLTFA